MEHETDPALHLSFRGHVLRGLDVSGRNTLRAVGLARRELQIDRFEALNTAKQVYRQACARDPAVAKILVRRLFCGREKRYSAMFEAWIATLP